MKYSQDMWLVLTSQSQDDQASVLIRWICPNISKAEIKGDDGLSLISTLIRQYIIGGTLHFLI